MVTNYKRQPQQSWKITQKNISKHQCLVSHFLMEKYQRTDVYHESIEPILSIGSL